jgi:hypothetical protein
MNEPNRRYWEALAVAPEIKDSEAVEIKPFMNFT